MFCYVSAESDAHFEDGHFLDFVNEADCNHGTKKYGSAFTKVLQRVWSETQTSSVDFPLWGHLKDHQRSALRKVASSGCFYCVRKEAIYLEKNEFILPLFKYTTQLFVC